MGFGLVVGQVWPFCDKSGQAGLSWLAGLLADWLAG